MPVWRTKAAAACGNHVARLSALNASAMVGAAPRHRSGAITGLTTTTRMTGTTAGVALTALIFSAAGSGPDQTRVVLWVAVGLALVAIAVSSTRLTPLGEEAAEI